ncbi:hypothetical protein [Streptomyces microflavus]|uniref:hypothetical protein n=1 Tax=Streptomyces microflavus TaxID=1919 RepID=UPI003B217A59
MPDIKALLAKARPREGSVTILLDGQIAGEIERLEAELLTVSEDWQPSDLTEQHPGRKVSEQIAKLRKQAKASEGRSGFGTSATRRTPACWPPTRRRIPRRDSTR